MKECFAILSYCNNEIKVDVLKKTINTLKQYDKDILLHAHYPINVEIQKTVNQYIFSQNPTPYRYNIFWWTEGRYKLEMIQYEYSITVLKQFKEILKILKNDYDIIHFIHCDANITPELYNITVNKIKEHNKSIFYENFVYDDAIHILYFSIIKKDFDLFDKICSVDNFYNFDLIDNMLPTLEVYMYTFLNNFYCVKKSEWELYINSFLENEISMINQNKRDWNIEQKNIFSAIQSRGCKLFIGDFNNMTGILIYKVIEPINIKIIINDKEMSLNIKDKTFISIDDTIEKDSIVNVYINNELIKDNIKDFVINNKCKITIN